MFLAIHVRDAAVETHAALLDCASVFSPRVENEGPNTVVLDVQGLERLFGSYSEIANHIADHIRKAGLEPNIAIASNPDAAIIAARGHAGVTIIENGEEAVHLKDLRIDLLPLNEDVQETLRLWGIDSFGALAKLPVKDISQRLGQDGVRLHNLARGAGSRPLVPEPPAMRFEEKMELDDPIDSIEPLTFILTRLLDQLFIRLRRRGLATSELHLALHHERPHERRTRILNLPFPVQKSRIVTKLLILDLEAHPAGAPVIGVKVEAIPAKPRVIQNGLFVPLSPEPEKLELTLARIAAVVGKGNVGKVEIADSHACDRFQIKTFGSCAARIPEFDFTQTMALRRWRPALEATVQIKHGTPVWIAFAGMHGPVERAAGPWNGSGDWWNASRWNREEWDIEIPGRTLLRIFKDCATDRWYADGVYD